MPDSGTEPLPDYARALGLLSQVLLQVLPNIYKTGCHDLHINQSLHLNLFLLRLIVLPAKYPVITKKRASRLFFCALTAADGKRILTNAAITLKRLILWID